MSKVKQASTRFVTLGHIQKTHAKDGEVSLRPDNLFVGEFSQQASFAIRDDSGGRYEHPLDIALAIAKQAPLWLTPPPLENRCLSARSVRPAANRLLIAFAGVADRTAARSLVGHKLLALRSDLDDELQEALSSLESALDAEEGPGLGLDVYSDSHGYLGTVAEVIETGANPVWVVRGERYGEVLLPVIDQCIQGIDEEKGIVEVIVMKGLIDED